jgi:hypothetical protein
LFLGFAFLAVYFRFWSSRHLGGSIIVLASRGALRDVGSKIFFPRRSRPLSGSNIVLDFHGAFGGSVRDFLSGLRVLRGSMFGILICVYLRLSRSNVRHQAVSRIGNSGESAKIIGTGFIRG